MTPDQKTAVLVPLADMTKLARLGKAMLRAQRAYFDARRATPHVPASTKLRDALAAEKAFDAACDDALCRERVPLPGMGGDTG